MAIAPMDDLHVLVGTDLAAGQRPAELVTAIYDAHQGELFSFALRSSRDREAAEDLVHEAFVRLIVELDAGREPANIRAWLYRVIANLVVSRARRAAVAQRQLGALVTQQVDGGPEPEFLEQERKQDIDAVLAEIGPDARTALLMAASGFNGLEIAEAIGRSAIATRALMCRSRLRLRERLGSMQALA
ncbi:MAG: polymerase, sigma-24 subunit, subfamily [Chloroflexota bacterium]|jgi:RNA polymerase sigma-70 factor (ECF subfamily)|nr:polymerase, sigma-24 subunit, subfamily [Chloroflexota bacterium]